MSHIDRVMDGFTLLMVLAVLVSILAAASHVVIVYGVPWVQTHSTKLGYTTLGVCVVVLVSYVLGYMRNDFIDDFREWRGESE